jgi:hypothetical protein
MADQGRFSEASRLDVARNFRRERGDDRAACIAARRRAGEAGDLDEMIAIAGNGRDAALPDVARGSG